MAGYQPLFTVLCVISGKLLRKITIKQTVWFHERQPEDLQIQNGLLVAFIKQPSLRPGFLLYSTRPTPPHLFFFKIGTSTTLLTSASLYFPYTLHTDGEVVWWYFDTHNIDSLINEATNEETLVSEFAIQI